MHGGHAVAEREKERRIHDYRLLQYQARVDDFASSERVLSLRGEIGVTRMTLEQLLNRCKDDQDLLLASSRVTMLVQQLQKLVETSARVESKLGQMMDRGTLQALCDSIVQIISDHVENVDILGQIANKVAGAISEAARAAVEE